MCLCLLSRQERHCKCEETQVGVLGGDQLNTQCVPLALACIQWVVNLSAAFDPSFTNRSGAGSQVGLEE